MKLSIWWPRYGNSIRMGGATSFPYPALPSRFKSLLDAPRAPLGLNPPCCREWRTWLDTTKRLDRTFLCVRCTSFHIHSLLTFFPCFIVLFQSCCSHARVFGKTLVQEFPIFYSHVEFNLLSPGTNTLVWWRASFKTTKLQTNKLLLFSPKGSVTGCNSSRGNFY